MTTKIQKILENTAGNSELHNAIVANNFEAIETEVLMLSAMGESANALYVTNAFGFNAVHLAALVGNIEVIELLAEFGADLSVYSDNGWNAIQLAAMGGYTDIVYFLEQKGESILSKNLIGQNCLHHAVTNDQKSMTEYCLVNSQKKLLMSAEDSHGYSAFARALKKGDLDVVKLFVVAGVDLFGFEEGTSALHMAVGYGHVHLAGYLMQHIDVNSINASGTTPIDVAEMMKNETMIKLLSSSAEDMEAATAAWNPDAELRGTHGAGATSAWNPVENTLTAAGGSSTSAMPSRTSNPQTVIYQEEYVTVAGADDEGYWSDDA